MVYPKSSGANGWVHACFSALCLAWLTLLLSGCKGDARMEGVTAEKAMPIHRFDHFQSVAKSDGRLVAVGAFGTIVVSDDSAKNWRRLELPGAPDLVRTVACGDGAFLALDVVGRLWRGGHDATQWDAVSIPVKDTVLDLACSQDNRVWVVGARGAIFSSSDMGQSWSDKSLSEDIQLLNVQFPSADTGIITGEFGRVLVSKDGGAHWQESGSLGPDFYPQGMSFRDAQHGAVVGLSGAFIETMDGGRTWTRLKAPTEAPLYGVLMLPAGQTVVVGAAGTAFIHADGAWLPLKHQQADMRGLTDTADGVVVAGAGSVEILPLPSHSSGTN